MKRSEASAEGRHEYSAESPGSVFRVWLVSLLVGVLSCGVPDQSQENGADVEIRRLETSIATPEPRQRGDDYYRRGQYDSAAIAYGEALKRLHGVAGADSVTLLLQSAAALSRNGRFSEARQLLLSAESALRPELSQSSRFRIQIELERAESHLRAGAFREALLLLQGGIFSDSTLSTTAAARRQFLLGWSFRLAGDYDKALEHLSLALEGAEDVGELGLDLRGDTYNQLGIRALDLGHYERAREHFESARAERSKTRNGLATALIPFDENLGLVDYRQGRYGSALGAFARAARVYSMKESVNLGGLARVFSNIGLIYWRVGQPSVALRFFAAALLIDTAAGHKIAQFEHLYHNRIGLAYQDIGNPRQALAHHLQSLSLKRRLFSDGHPDIAHALNNIGIVHLSTGDLASSREFLEQALHLRMRSFGIGHDDVAATLLNLAALDAESGDLARSLRGARSAISIAAAILPPEHPLIAQARNQLAEQYEALGRHAEALGQLDTVITVLAPGDDVGGTKNWHGSIELLDAFKQRARIYRQLSGPTGKEDVHLASSLADYRSLVYCLGAVRRRYRMRESKLFLAENEAGIIEEAIDTALEIWRRTGAQEFVDLAFEFSEAGRFGALLDAMISAAAVPSSTPRYDSETVDLPTQLERLGITLPARSDSTAARALSVLDLLPAVDFEALLEEARHPLPTYSATSFDDWAVNVSALRRDWHRGTPVLEYHVGSDSVVTFVFNGSELHATTFERHGLDSLIQQFVTAISSRQYDSYVESARELYEHLVSPVQRFLTRDDVLIIPHDILLRVPFEALLAAPVNRDTFVDYAELPYWGRQITVRYAYSLALARHLRSSRQFQRNATLLAVAPAFDKEPRGIDDAADGVLPRLPEAEREVWDLWRLFNAGRPISLGLPMDRARVMFGDNASLQSLEQLDLSKYRYVHFATHAFVRDDNVEQSGLVLYPTDPREEYSVLTVSELPRLRLNAELAVLSACDTGGGRIVRGEGLLGLTGTFLEAGAQNVVVSLWRANDLAARHLMLPFYQRLLSDVSPATALRRSKEEMISGGGPLAHPVYWASFVLIGI
jgi:CHAT domain-containing protein/tetratricopeptide (TPR) repeat protein